MNTNLSIKMFAVALLAFGSFGTVGEVVAQTVAPIYKKVWWNQNQNGMGTFCDQQKSVTAGGISSEVIFCSWFHYTPAKQPTFMIFSGTLAKDSLGRDTLTTALIRPTGTQPLGYDPTQFATSAPGTAKITFNSESSATFEYSFDGQSGILNWVPQIYAVDQTALKYFEKVYAIWSNLSYPFSVTKTGVTKVVNKTSFISSTLEYSYFNCWLASKPLGDGKVLASCQEDRTGNVRKTLYIDPEKNEMYDYIGTVPTDIVWLVTATNSDKPEWKAKARVSDGWYFTTFDITWVLKFQPDTGAIITVKAGTFSADGNVRVLVTYTN